MIRRAASHDINFVDSVQKIFIPVEFVKDNRAAVLGNAFAHGVADGFRLLVNFFQHEMFVAALFRRLSVPSDVEDFFINALALPVQNLHGIFFDKSNLAVI